MLLSVQKHQCLMVISSSSLGTLVFGPRQTSSLRSEALGSMMLASSIMAPRAPDLRLEVPTSIEDPEGIMKLIHATTAALHAPREVRAATATRRSIYPLLVTFVITLT